MLGMVEISILYNSLLASKHIKGQVIAISMEFLDYTSLLRAASGERRHPSSLDAMI